MGVFDNLQEATTRLSRCKFLNFFRQHLYPSDDFIYFLTCIVKSAEIDSVTMVTRLFLLHAAQETNL